MAKPNETPHTNAFLRRMHYARMRQLSIAVVSVVVATLGVAIMSPDSVGGFAFYSIIILLVINAITALVQFQRVIRPTTTLLRRLQTISENLNHDNGSPIEHLACETEDSFSCLAASFDDVLSSYTEKLRRTEALLKQQEEIVAAIPIALVVVSRSGKIFQMVKEQPDVKMPEGLEPGQLPSERVWGAENIIAFREALEQIFKNNQTRWFDAKATTPAGVRNFRVSLRKMNEFSALMTMSETTDLENSFSIKAENFRHHEASIKRTAMRHLAATIAHDAKNVFSALQNLVDANRVSSDPAVIAGIPMAEDAISRGTNLMEELVNFAGDTRPELKCQPARDCLTPIIESPTIQALMPKNLKLTTAIADQKFCEIDVDTNQLWKVVLNLVKNAVEALKDREGRIWLKLSSCKMNDELARTFRHTATLRNGDGVLIEITDDGPGIPESMLDHVFDPYVSNKGSGRGLGLATAMTIIDAHGGAISVKSLPGYGTSFYIFLPESRNTSEDLKMIREVAPNGEVLLVDDDQTILHTTSMVLRVLKVAAHSAANENDALAKLRSLRQRLRAVLVDANLGGLNSSGLVRTIHHEYPELPVIVVSGSTEDYIARQFGDVRYDRFLSKPYSLTDLSRTLNEVAPLK